MPILLLAEVDTNKL